MVCSVPPVNQIEEMIKCLNVIWCFVCGWCAREEIRIPMENGRDDKLLLAVLLRIRCSWWMNYMNEWLRLRLISAIDSTEALIIFDLLFSLYFSGLSIVQFTLITSQSVFLFSVLQHHNKISNGCHFLLLKKLQLIWKKWPLGTQHFNRTLLLKYLVVFLISSEMQLRIDVWKK